MQQSFFYLIYISIATELMSEDNLIKLLDQSRQNNAEIAVTGILLYMEGRYLDKLEGRFMQLLEGAEDDVRMLYERILVDGRNHSVLVLKTGHYDTRSFPDWSMGFETVNEEAAQSTPAYVKLDSTFLESAALILL
jgi:hypothetical protein